VLVDHVELYLVEHVLLLAALVLLVVVVGESAEVLAVLDEQHLQVGAELPELVLQVLQPFLVVLVHCAHKLRFLVRVLQEHDPVEPVHQDVHDRGLFVVHVDAVRGHEVNHLKDGVEQLVLVFLRRRHVEEGAH